MPIIWVQSASLVNPPVQCAKVDFKDKNSVKWINKREAE
jgi:hypothetical protein